MSTTATRLDWVLFVLLGAIWGSSYLFIKIGVEAGLGPFTLVMLRLVFGTALLGAVALATRVSLPRDGRTLGHLLVLGVLSIALPFSLVAWAEQHVDSTLASIVGSAIPLIVVVIAAFVLRAERLAPSRGVGLLVGLAGVAILIGFDPQGLTSSDPTASLALLGATVSYAVGGVYAKRMLHGLTPVAAALGQVGAGLLLITPIALVTERPDPSHLTPASLLAVVWLGLLGSGIAYLLFFRLLGRLGATRTSMVAYVMPIVGVALGALVLREAVQPTLIIGAALVVAGIVLVNTTARPSLPSRRPRSTARCAPISAPRT